ncbi:MAG: TetR/AcrR family transcriptional regulator [Rhodoglobus sp.]
MTRRSDPRPKRSQRALAEALLELVHERDLADITPSDVATRAGVSRSTFYLHFTDLHALAVDACTEQFDELLALAPTERVDDLEELRAHLRLFFLHVQSNTRLYLALLGSSGSAEVSTHLRDRLSSAIVQAVPPSGEQPVSRSGAAFLAGGLVAVAQAWLERESEETVEELSKDVAATILGHGDA